MEQSCPLEPEKNTKGSPCNNIQGLAASSMSSSGTYVLGSLLATRSINDVYPYKLYGGEYNSALKRFLKLAKSPHIAPLCTHAEIIRSQLRQCMLVYPSYSD